MRDTPRTRFGAWFLALVLLPVLAHAQTQGAPEEADVPTGDAVLSGEVVHPGAPPGEIPGAGVEVLLYALPGNAAPGLRHGRSDETGHFRFEGISNHPDTVYLVGARYRGIPFPGARVRFEPGQRERDIKVRIGELSDDASGLRVRELEIRLEWLGHEVQVNEVVRIDNENLEVAHIDETKRAEGGALFSLSVPEGARDLVSPFGIPLEGLARDAERLRFFGPVYPSAWGGPFSRRQEIAFQYTLDVEGAAFKAIRALPTETPPVERVVVIAGAGFEELHVEGAVQSVEEGVTRWLLEGDSLAAGVSLSAHFPAAQRDRNALSRQQSRVFLELDGAALSVREEHFFRVEGDAPLLASSEDALLQFSLPAAASDLRFTPGADKWGLRNEDGALHFRGPLPVGEHQFDLAYQIPRTHDAVAYDFESAPATPLLSVFVADTGVLIATKRLHRRRPVNAGTRTYAHWEAFQIDAGERVEVALRALRDAGTASRVTVSGFGAALAALAALLLLAPLGGARKAPARESADPARVERNAIYAALRDLDHDYETGKVSDQDFTTLRAELRGRAAALFASDDLGVTPDSVTLPQIRSCGACGEPAGSKDRFCAQCGSALESPS